MNSSSKFRFVPDKFIEANFGAVLITNSSAQISNKVQQVNGFPSKGSLMALKKII
jgi:hypothetical protein